MLTVLLVVQIVVTVVMIVTILMQQNANDGLGGLGGGQQPSLSVDSGSALSKLTGWLAAVFMANSLLMAAMASSSKSDEDKIIERLTPKLPSERVLPQEGGKTSIPVPAEEGKAEDKTEAPAAASVPAPAVPVAPDVAEPEKAAESPAAVPAEVPSPAPTPPADGASERQPAP
jgi:preprotein translocase subunit SecG